MARTIINNVPRFTAPNPGSSSCSVGGCAAPLRGAARRGMDAPPVVVDGEVIAEEDIAREAQHHEAENVEEARALAARALVVRTLLLNRARALALAPEPEQDAAGRTETQDEALIRQVLALEVAPDTPSEVECRRVYKARAAEFTAPTLFEASHILFAPRASDEAARAEATAAANEAITQIAGDEGRFRQFAKTRSECPSGAVGGSLGQLRSGDLVRAIEIALDALAPGAIAADPVLTRFGAHIVRLDRRIEGRALPYSAVASRIKDQLSARAWTGAAAGYVANLAKAARLEGIALEARHP